MWRARLALVVACASALYESEPMVATFETVTEFEERVVKDEKSVWVITLYAGTECTSCEAMAGAFASAAGEVATSLGVKAGAMDLMSPLGQKLGKRWNIEKVPAFVAFSGRAQVNPYTGKSGRGMAMWNEFNEGFSASGFKRWVSKLLPTDAVERVESLSGLTYELPTAVIVTERSTTSAMAKSLGMPLVDRLKLVEIGVADAAGLVDEGEPLPALLRVDAGGVVTSKYEGDFKDRAAVLAWLEELALKEPKKEVKDEKPWAPYDPTTVRTRDELSRLAGDAALVVGKAPPQDIAKKVAELDGSGVLRGVVCDEVEGWEAYGFGGGSLGSFADAKTAFEAAAASVPADDVTLVGFGSLDGFMNAAVQDVPNGVVIFAAKDEINVGVKALARLLARTVGVRVAQYVVDKDDPNDLSILQRFQVPKAPWLLSFHAQPDKDAPAGAMALGLAHYDRNAFGPLTFQSMVAFVDMLLRQLDEDAAAEFRDAYLDDRTVAIKAPKQKTSSGDLHDANDPKVFDKVCDAQLCALFLLDQYGRPDAFQAELDVAREVAKQESSAPYSFAWFDGACHLDLALAFDVDPLKLPTLVAYAPKKGRFAPYVGSFAPKDLRAFLRSVVSGRTTTGPLRSKIVKPDPGLDCAALANPAQVDAIDQDDVDDFMAEILAEEKAEKARRDQEAKEEAERLDEERRRQDEENKQAPKKKKKKKTKKKQPEL